MNWKTYIKSWIPVIPFLPQTRRQILGLTRSEFEAVTLDTTQYIFEDATFEKDCQEIVANYPAEEFSLFLEKEQRQEEITRRFQERIPCFIVREKDGNRLLGAVWMYIRQFDYLFPDKRYTPKIIFEPANLFVVPEQRGKGLGKQLLSFAIECIFTTTNCDFVVSRVKEREQRIASLLSCIKIGFSVLGTYSAQKVFGIYVTHFSRTNTNPFFNDFPKTPVVLRAWDGSNPLGIIRSLGRHGVPLYVLTSASNPSLAWSRYVKKIIPLTLSSPGDTLSSAEDKKTFQGLLMNLLQEIDCHSGKPILIVTNESHYTDHESSKEFLNEHFNVLTPLEKAVPLTTKHNQFPLAAQAGFRVMETIILRSADDLKLIEDKLVFPIIVRPMSNTFREQLGMKTALYENIYAMREHLEPILKEYAVELIAQEYVPGTDRDIIVFMASCDETGEPRIWLSGRKVRQNPPGRGVMASGLVDSVPDPNFVEKSKNLCRLFGLRGFIGIECKQHAITKEYVYIESSFRPEGFNAMCLAANVDLVWDAYLTALNKPCGTVRPEFPKGSWACAEYEHGTMKVLRNQGDPNWWKVLIPLPRPIAYAFFSWDDPMPFVHSFTTLVLRKIKAMCSRFIKLGIGIRKSVHR